MTFHAGLDWGGASHSICVVDSSGQIVARCEVRHDAAGLRALLASLRKIAPAADLPIAIERPTGLLVDTLVGAGHPIVPIHPNVVKACRPRYRAAGGKSDPGDAYMLADILRTDGHRFRPLSPVSDDIRALRVLVRGRDDLVAQRIVLANQLRSLLDSFWPGAAAIFAAIDSPIALAFVGRYPTPDSASRLGEKRLASFLAQHSYCGRRSPAQLLDRLHAAPGGHAQDAEADANGELVRALAALLEQLVTQIAKLSARIEHAVAELPDGQIVMSFPRTGRICAAQILAELGNVRQRYLSDDHLAAEAGVCPVTHASGKSRGVVFRWAEPAYKVPAMRSIVGRPAEGCNHRLRQAITCFADNSRHASPWAADIYARAKARGCTHQHATRILARAWVRVLWRAWQNHAKYNPDIHQAALKLAA